ncbi:MAG: ATP-grasp domain-containing protein [Deltaproteobacteria bacterium]|nr:ATP-grasp domain-containing protein [Deltaproteobacteria bacterium]
MTAYSRIIPAYFNETYHIIALRKTGDLPLIRRKATTFCLEEETADDFEAGDMDSFRLLSHASTRGFLNRLPGPVHLLLYQGYPDLENMAAREGWHIIANPSKLRVTLAGRAYFRDLIQTLEINGIPGGVYPVQEIYSRGYNHWADKIAPSFVIKLAEIRQGGGKGVFFIHSPHEYETLRKNIKDGIWRGTKIESFSIEKFIDGIPVSLALCITRHGILFSGLQRQLMDLPYCQGIPEAGIFCGHSWGETRWPISVKEEAFRQAGKICRHIAHMGYKGILGIDFVVDRKTRRVYPIEMNPRFTGAFPVLSQFHLYHQLIPMEVFHILEFLDIPYEIDVEEINRGYAQPLHGGHLILFRLMENRKLTGNIPKSGIYECHPDYGPVCFSEMGIDINKIMGGNRFLLADGPPDKPGERIGSHDPLRRLCRFLFPFPVVDSEGELSVPGRASIEWFYRHIFGT